VKEVLFVAAVSWEENTVLLNDVLADEGTEAAAAWKDRADRAVPRVGFLNCGGGIGDDMNSLIVCFPFEVFVNFDLSEQRGLSDGRFLVLCCKETGLLAWKSVCAGLDEGVGDGE
jgi:hypothetical protein